MVACSQGGTLALLSASSSPSAPTALPGLSVAGVLVVGATGLDVVNKEDLMVRNMFSIEAADDCSYVFFLLSYCFLSLIQLTFYSLFLGVSEGVCPLRNSSWSFLHCPEEDECANDHHHCNSTQDCHDLPQGYHCTCKQGYILSR